MNATGDVTKEFLFHPECNIKFAETTMHEQKTKGYGKAYFIAVF
jgi:hypothetical protein